MKKVLGPLCAIATGVVAFVALSLHNLFVKTTMGGFSETDGTSGWDAITGGSAGNGWGDLFRVSTIILLVLACLLVVWGLLALLKNLKVLKVKGNFSLLTNLLLTLFAVFAILAWLGALVYGSKNSYSMGGVSFTATAGIGTYINLVLGLLGCVLAWIYARKDA